MSSKKKNPTTPATPNLPTVTIGSRVRCTDDGVTGRITWANGVSVKIKWDDGEQVTWRRDSLATRPIEFLDVDAASDDGVPGEPPVATLGQEQTPPQQSPAEPTGATSAPEQG